MESLRVINSFTSHDILIGNFLTIYICLCESSVLPPDNVHPLSRHNEPLSPVNTTRNDQLNRRNSARSRRKDNQVFHSNVDRAWEGTFFGRATAAIFALTGPGLAVWVAHRAAHRPCAPASRPCSRRPQLTQCDPNPFPKACCMIADVQNCDSAMMPLKKRTSTPKFSESLGP